MTKEEPNWLGTLWNVDQSLAKQAEKYLEDEKKSDFEFLDKMAVENEKKNARIRELEEFCKWSFDYCRGSKFLLNDLDISDDHQIAISMWFNEVSEKAKQLLNQKQS